MKKISLHTVILSMLLLFVVSVAGTLSVLSYRQETSRTFAAMAESITNTPLALSAILAHEQESLIQTVTVLIRIERFTELFLAKDREKLLAASTPLFEEIKREFGITHLYFIEPEGTVFLRVHKPEQHGDVLDRITYLEARKTGRTSAGIEMGKNFFSLRAVSPVRREGNVIGYFEIGKEIDHIYPWVKAVTQTDLSLFITREFIQKKAARPKGESLKDVVLIESTAKGAATVIASTIDFTRWLTESGIVRVDAAEGHFIVGLSPFKDAAGEVAGVLMVQRDFTEIIADSIQSLWKNVAVIFGILLFFFLVIALAVKKTLKEKMTKPILSVMDGLITAAEQAAAMSHQISSSSRSLASETSEQARHIETLYASGEAMAALSRQNAESASSADSLMNTSVVMIQETNQSMGALNRSMKDMAESSQKAGNIIKTIDEIAFQTNLLALNAAVEAARAGEVGAGFSVVAQEVRHLAQRAAEAAKNTSVMIEETVEKIRTGSEIVGKVYDSFGRVAGNAGQARELIETIASGVRRQTDGIETIAHTLAGIETGIQTTAANADESAGTSAQMKIQADQVMASVEKLSKIIGKENSQRKALVSIEGRFSLPD